MSGRWLVSFTVVLLSTITAESSFAECTHYASPNGGGNGLSDSSPFRIVNFWPIAGPGKTLCLRDGVYQGDASMIRPPKGLNGQNGNPITIRAYNDGGALIDGQFQRDPVVFWGNSWFVLEGFNARSGNSGTLYTSNSGNNVFRRMVVWDANIAGNTAVWQIFASTGPTLIEDVGIFGTGRKTFTNAQGGDDVTLRRAWVRFDGSTGGAPIALAPVYNSYRIHMEDVLVSWSGSQQPQQYNEHNSWPPTDTGKTVAGYATSGWGAILSADRERRRSQCKLQPVWRYRLRQ
jgi:hypothetical protein